MAWSRRGSENRRQRRKVVLGGEATGGSPRIGRSQARAVVVARRKTSSVADAATLCHRVAWSRRCWDLRRGGRTPSVSCWEKAPLPVRLLIFCVCVRSCLLPIRCYAHGTVYGQLLDMVRSRVLQVNFDAKTEHDMIVLFDMFNKLHISKMELMTNHMKRCVQSHNSERCAYC